VISHEVGEERIEGKKRVVAELGMHAVFDVPLEYLSAALHSTASLEEFVPGVKQSRLLCEADGDPPYFRQRLRTSFGVLFFRSGYDAVMEMRIHDGSDEYRCRFELRRSVDGKLLRIHGSWYARPVQVDGQERAYIRYHVRNVFAKKQLGLKMVLRRFSAWQVRRTLKAYAERGRELERRAATASAEEAVSDNRSQSFSSQRR
jgi:hypothetical protein